MEYKHWPRGYKMKSINGKTPNSLCSVGIKLRKRVRNSVLDVVDGIQTLAKRIQNEKYQW